MVFFAVTEKQTRAGMEVAHLVKHLPCKHKDLAQTPGCKIKTLGLVACAWNPSAGESEAADSLGFTSQSA